MKISKNQLIVSLISIAILIVSLTFALLDALIPLNLFIHPILNFLLVAFIGFGVLTLILGIIKSSPWYMFLSAVLIGLALVYLLIQFLGEMWWLSLLVVGVVWIIFAILSFIYSGNKTENIALNKSTDYKDYKTRKKEEKNSEDNGEKKELPKIKSFK